MYRLDRRFVLQAIGVTLLLTAVALLVALVIGQGIGAAIAWIVAAALAVRAGLLWFRPPVVARLDDTAITVGGQLTVKPVTLPWADVEKVSYDEGRLLVDRGTESVVVFPTVFVGARAYEMVREVYDRLNTANGYRRFDPEKDSGEQDV